MSKKSRFPELKQEIKIRAAASREIRKRIHASQGMDRWLAWSDKRSHGSDTRCLLLIYAMLRGIPRVVLEAKHDRYDFYRIHMGMHCMAGERGIELAKEAIETWLKVAAPATTLAEALEKGSSE